MNHIQSISPLWSLPPTGQLDNPAQLSLALYKAEVSMSMLTQLRDRAMNAYSELSRINL